jgi:hypothetical protein
MFIPASKIIVKKSDESHPQRRSAMGNGQTTGGATCGSHSVNGTHNNGKKKGKKHMTNLDKNDFQKILNTYLESQNLNKYSTSPDRNDYQTISKLGNFRIVKSSGTPNPTNGPTGNT